MNLDDFILPCFCVIDEMLPTVTNGKRLRARGPMPKLADSELVTIQLCVVQFARSGSSAPIGSVVA